MAGNSTSYTEFSNVLQDAEQYYSVDLAALNSSGVTGSIVAAVSTREDDSSVLSLSIDAAGLTPNVQHAQHIHGLFDDDRNAIDSTTPGLQNDSDRDGMVEVIEGVPSYGDILLPLLNEDGIFPSADADGNLSFVTTYDLSDDSQFMSAVTGNSYTSEDLFPLIFREIVLHGVDVPSGIGQGTDGEVDGDQNGYVPLLPAGAGELMSIDMEQALDIFEDQMTRTSMNTTLTEGDDTFDAGAGEDTVFGGAGNDNIRGGANDDVLDGGQGNDVANGNEGDDTVIGGSGDDSLVGGRGSDVVSGGIGADVLAAGGGDTNRMNAADTAAAGALSLDDYDNAYAGGAGDDLLAAGDGDDIITGDDDSRVSSETGETFDAMADGNDTIYGGAGNDEIHVGSWADGDDGFDNTHTGTGNDFASGGSGNDILIGDAGSDTLMGGTGNDTVSAGGGDDVVTGGDNNDILTAGDGMDVVSGGTGADAIMAGSDENAVNAADDGAAGSLGIEDYDNAYAGGVGNDTIMGGAGDDIITGDDDSRVSSATGETFNAFADGVDRIFGGAGNDEIHVGSWADGDDGFDNSHRGAADDFASGGDGDDILIGDNGNDTLRGDAGVDTIKAGGGADMIDGGDGADDIDAGAGNDMVYGGAGDDMVLGAAGSDTLVGQNGNDVMTGGAGSDVLFGGDGNDFVNGGFANDRINTGSGSDMIYHAGVTGHGTDYVQDFDGDNDVFVFGGDQSATGDDFLVQFSAAENAGADDVAEAYVTYKPTGQILWVAIDGADEDALNVMVNGQSYDLFG